jgi:lysophospholipase L1-like esterase
MAVFYDNARNKLSVVTTTDGAVSRQVYEGKISVPSGACYVRCNWHKGSGDQYFGYTINNGVVAKNVITTKVLTKCNIVAKPFTLSGGNAIGFGDSIMYGYRSLDPTDVSSNPWPNLVKDALGLNNFTNRAVGGAGFTRGTTILTQITGQTLNTRDLIFIAAGTNDFHYGASLSSFSDAVNAVFDYVDTNKGSQTKVIVITPINRSQAPRVENGASLDVYRSILTELALERGYSVLDGSSFGFPQVESDYQDEVLNDGLHPTDKGYVIYANAVCGLLS